MLIWVFMRSLVLLMSTSVGHGESSMDVAEVDEEDERVEEWAERVEEER